MKEEKFYNSLFDNSRNFGQLYFLWFLNQIHDKKMSNIVSKFIVNELINEEIVIEEIKIIDRKEFSTIELLINNRYCVMLCCNREHITNYKSVVVVTNNNHNKERYGCLNVKLCRILFETICMQEELLLKEQGFAIISNQLLRNFFKNYVQEHELLKSFYDYLLNIYTNGNTDLPLSKFVQNKYAIQSFLYAFQYQYPKFPIFWKNNISSFMLNFSDVVTKFGLMRLRLEISKEIKIFIFIEKEDTSIAMLKKIYSVISEMSRDNNLVCLKPLRYSKKKQQILCNFNVSISELETQYTLLPKLLKMMYSCYEILLNFKRKQKLL